MPAGNQHAVAAVWRHTVTSRPLDLFVKCVLMATVMCFSAVCLGDEAVRRQAFLNDLVITFFNGQLIASNSFPSNEIISYSLVRTNSPAKSIVTLNRPYTFACRMLDSQGVEVAKSKIGSETTIELKDVTYKSIPERSGALRYDMPGSYRVLICPSEAFNIDKLGTYRLFVKLAFPDSLSNHVYKLSWTPLIELPIIKR